MLLYYLKIGYNINLSLFPVFILIKSKQILLTDLENCSSIQHVPWTLTWNKKLISIFIYQNFNQQCTCKYIVSIKIFVKHLILGLFIVSKFNMRMKLNITLFNILSNVMSWHLIRTKIVLYQWIISINQFNNVSIEFHFNTWKYTNNATVRKFNFVIHLNLFFKIRFFVFAEN